MLQVKLMPCAQTLNESPSEKEGKCLCYRAYPRWYRPSMKVPPKRKGNARLSRRTAAVSASLNESPSQKEGKLMALAVG